MKKNKVFAGHLTYIENIMLHIIFYSDL